MDESYGTYVDDEYFDNHDYDDDTDDDTDISTLQYGMYKIPKASSKRVPDLGTSPGHKPIIDQSCRAVLFFSR